MSTKAALASFDHIELTEEEQDEGILWAKQRKEQRLKQVELNQRAEANRKLLTGTQWTYEQTRSFMSWRANKLFGDEFALDQDNEFVFNMLCYYFSNDRHFISMASALQIKNPSLDKGIFLAGNFGVGKTWFMKLFSKNQRQVFHVHNAKEIANQFEADGLAAIDHYSQKYKNPVNDTASFLQTFAGLCIDDFGTEDIKNHFGNKKNVIGDVIEERYRLGNCGIFLHGTTNLTSQALNDFYGGRVISRLREEVNFIELPGKDRRK